eukprot:6177025-Pleurochrysis_carterae.AAC.4
MTQLAPAREIIRRIRNALKACDLELMISSVTVYGRDQFLWLIHVLTMWVEAAFITKVVVFFHSADAGYKWTPRIFLDDSLLFCSVRVAGGLRCARRGRLDAAAARRAARGDYDRRERRGRRQRSVNRAPRPAGGATKMTREHYLCVSVSEFIIKGSITLRAGWVLKCS